MANLPDSRRIEIAEVFRRVQAEMIAHLSISNLVEHTITQGTLAEQEWIRLFNSYLPSRYRSASGFVINADGRRSRQIDLIVFETFSSPQLFPRDAVPHVAVESVYAVFEIKSQMDGNTIRDAGKKIASVRQLRSDPTRPILGGVLAPMWLWSRDGLRSSLTRNLEELPHLHSVEIGCALKSGSFEFTDHLVVSRPEESLMFFLLRLVERLDALGPVPRVDLMRYARGVRSFEW